MLKIIPLRLKELRTARRWSLAQVADRLDVPKSTYANYEYGNRDIPNDLLPKIAELYHVPADYILGLVDESDNWKTVEELGGEDNQDIAEMLKKVGVSLIRLNAELLERGISRDELERFLHMMLELKASKKEPPSPL